MGKYEDRRAENGSKNRYGKEDLGIIDNRLQVALYIRWYRGNRSVICGPYNVDMR